MREEFEKMKSKIIKQCSGFHNDRIIKLRALEPVDYENLACFFKVLEEFNVSQFFHPHSFNPETARQICEYEGRDWYAALFVKDQELSMIVGYVILRGWDEGFTIPSFGVCVHPNWQGLGLGRLLTWAAIAIARLRQSPAIRLKVYPSNHQAIALYSSIGFEFDNNLENDQLVGILPLTKKKE